MYAVSIGFVAQMEKSVRRAHERIISSNTFDARAASKVEKRLVGGFRRRHTLCR